MQGLYLLTDGKPDTSRSLVLREVQRLSEGRAVRVHTIALTRSGRWGPGTRVRGLRASSPSAACLRPGGLTVDAVSPGPVSRESERGTVWAGAQQSPSPSVHPKRTHQ